ncbi:MAG: zf-TFIIB domain-containing protein [Archangiaceae bacterium]|nr:zf-TFIIB domain-containing protein [Archangiaceae bacterium]
MRCPQCDVDLTDLENEDEHVYVCPDGHGTWSDGSQLNALLLRHTLPGLDSIGGRADPDAETGTCRQCGVSLTRLEQSGRREDLYFETCEDCGFVWVNPEDEAPAADFKAAQGGLVAFFKRFSGSAGGAKKR